MTPALDLLGRLLDTALGIEEGVAPRPVGGDLEQPVATTDLLEAVRRHRVPEVLHHHARVLGLADDVTRVLAALVEANRQRHLIQAFETARAWRLLDAAGIEAMVVKGIPLALLTTGAAHSRGAGDIDLLVRPADTVETHRRLTSAGWALDPCGRVEPEMWAWRHNLRWGRTLTYLGAGCDVDLHWRLDTMPRAHPDPSVLFGRAARVDVGGVDIPTLAPSDALRHLAGHREGWTWLRTLVDLRRLARDPAVFDGAQATLNEPALVSLALTRATIGLPATVPRHVHAALDGVPASSLIRARARHAQPTQAWGGTSAAGEFRNGLAVTRSPQDLAHLAMGIVLPAHAALSVRSTSAWRGVPRALALRGRSLAHR